MRHKGNQNKTHAWGNCEFWLMGVLGICCCCGVGGGGGISIRGQAALYCISASQSLYKPQKTYHCACVLVVDLCVVCMYAWCVYAWSVWCVCVNRQTLPLKANRWLYTVSSKSSSTLFNLQFSTRTIHIHQTHTIHTTERGHCVGQAVNDVEEGCGAERPHK